MQREKEIEALERRFPELAVTAFTQARARALAIGLTVVETQDAMLYEVFPDGTRKAIKPIEPPTLVVKGSRHILR